MLFLLLLLTNNGQADDGCQGKHGYVYWRCGDVCTSAYDSTKQDCTCGGQTFGFDDGKWCCGRNCTGGCLEWKREDNIDGDHPLDCAHWSPVNCTNGVALPLEQSCNGLCNENPDDEHRNTVSSRSHVASCANTSTCVKEGEGITGSNNGIPFTPTICTGDSSCEGELAWCRKDERKNETCPTGFIQCSSNLGGSKKKKKGSSETNRIPGQCIDPAKAKDGSTYHCLDRTDENPFQEVGKSTNQQKIDFARLKKCTNRRGKPGLECGGKESSNCIYMGDWCKGNMFRHKCPVLGTDIYTNTPKVCQEYRFWQDKPCWNEDQVRCRAGHSGQCVGDYSGNYWGIEEAKDRDGFGASCKDGSDLYRPITVNAEEPSTPQVWKTRPVDEDNFNQKGGEERAKYRKDSLTELWVIPETNPFQVPSVGEWDIKHYTKFYSKDYVRDSSTGLWMAALTEETCKANDGFVCKVRLGF